MRVPWGASSRELRVIEDVMAVRLVPDALGLSGRQRLAARDVQRLFGERVRASAAADASVAAWGAFEAAGFEFVRPLDEVRDLAAGGGEVRGARGVYPVAVDEDDQLVLLTGHCAFEVTRGTDPDIVVDALRQRGAWPQKVLRLGLDRVVIARTARDVDPPMVAGIAGWEPVLLERIPPRRRPTDPRYEEQWHWCNDGRNGGRVGADVGAERAWDNATGAGRRIAVIDAGFHLQYPDLVGAWRRAVWFERVGIDADFRVVHAGSVAGYPTDNHGTGVAGIALARVDTGLGGCGLAFQAEWLPIACLPDHVGTQVTLARALAYAADPRCEEPAAQAGDGADVVVCSLGPNSGHWRRSRALELAIEAVVTQGRGGLGTPVFWAVANSQTPIVHDGVCADSRVVAVGRSNRLDLADGSAFGPELDFLAPGVEVLTTSDGGRYRVASGTSYAAPIAAAAAAMVLEREPDLGWEAVRDRLRQACKWIGPGARPADGRDDRHGFGRLNASDALT